MAAAQVDVPRLAAYVSLPVDDLNTLTTAPSPNLVQLLFTKLSQKADEHDNLAAAKLRIEVELENAVRSSEQKARLMKANLEKAQKQATELRHQLDTEHSLRQTVATELEVIKNSTSSSGTELSNLQQRISSLESSNRDTLALLESKSRSHDGLAQELAAKHQKTVELRREVSDLEDKVRAASTAATSAKFREQAFEQEVESLKRSNDYLDNELKTKTTEYSKFRKDKNARVAGLQRQHEDDTTTIESLQRSEKALRTRTSELEQKAEDYLSQIQQVKEELTRQEDTFRTELDSANRLQELMREQAETEKNRRAELQEQYESVQDEAREEFAKIEEEMRTIQDDKDEADRRVAELETQVERLERDMATLSAVPAPGTPRFNGSIRPGSAPRTPARGMSPSAPGSALRGSVSFTKLITDYHDVRKERDTYKKRSEELAEQVDSIMQELEQRRPALEQMTTEHSRLQSDVAEMSSLVESIGMERDAAKKEARSCQGQVSGLVREGEILRQQLRDLSSQIKVLLLEVNARDQGKDSFTADERIQLEQLAKDSNRDYVNNTDQFISENLVSFKNIAELQTQNERLLRITRELGDKLEGDEAQARQTQAAQDHEEVTELRQKYERVRDEMRSLMTQSQAYIRERDIFRRMLSHRGQLPPPAEFDNAFGQSVNGPPPSTPARNGLHASVEMSPNSKDVADYNKLIKDMQSHFDGYKQEASAERTQLKDEISSLSSKNAELRNELARKGGEVLLATGRHEMLQGNYSLLKTENVELQKRSQAASDRATQQDLRVQAVAEELVETRGMVESLRSEGANLKAEKDFWKTVEKRLTDDNQALITERDRLNTLNSNLQNLLNEREHSDHESRRRLQSQVETLESEVQTTRRKLSETEDEAKRSALRREYDSQQAQTRIDDLVKTVSATREELSGTKATRDQLQLRVDEVTIELRSAEERLQLLSKPAGDGTAQDEDAAADQEQELALQVSELKRDLELAKRDLANAQEQVEQYKQISQSSEEELQSLNDSHDQYRQEMDQLIEEKESKVKELEETIENMRKEADESNAELETLRTEKENHDHALREQRAQLESEINRFKDAAERAETAAQFHQEDLKAQAEIARQAQENYDTELQKHAEASKAVQAIRTELNEARLELVELRSARDAAQSGLSQAEESWTESKTRYENELAEIRSRRDDIARQNKLLHEQLEKVNNQVTELQRARATGGVPASPDNAASNSDDGNLQELVRYLRREKEIVDVQYEMANQESKRLRQKLDQTQAQLEDSRLKLTQQLRSEEDRERSALNHNKLVETINELNLIRESNATLRLEKNQAQAALTERIKEIEELQSQLQPLHAKVQELEEIRESQEQDLRMTREARERFEQRYHDMLNKTDSIDPAEFESLKEQSTNLEVERDSLKTQTASLQEQIETIPAQIEDAVKEVREQAAASRARIVQQAKDKNTTQVSKIKQVEAALQDATVEKTKLEEQLGKAAAELSAANTEKAEIQAKLDQALATQSTAQSTAAPAASSPDNEQLAALQKRLEEMGDAAKTHDTQVQNFVQQCEQKDDQIAEKTRELATARTELANIQQKVQSLENSTSDQGASGHAALDTEQLDRLRDELAAAQKDADALRAAADVTDRAANIQEGEGQPSIADQISQSVEAIRGEMTAQYEERAAAATKRADDAIQKMKEHLNGKMREYRSSETQRLKAEYDQQVEALNEAHRAEIAALQSSHQAEIEKLQRQPVAVTPKAETNGETDSAETPTAPTSAQSHEDVKKLLQTSDVAKRILASNITKKVAEAKEVLTKEFEGKLADFETKAKATQEAAVKNAVEMETKRQSVKLNMSENRAKVLTVKWQYVQTAAEKTPTVTVLEVYNVAKDLKPQPAAVGGLAKSVHAPSATSSPAGKAPGMAQPSPKNNSFSASSGNPFATSQGATGPLQSTQSAKPQADPIANTETQTGAANESAANGQAPSQPSTQTEESKTEGQPIPSTQSRPLSRPGSSQSRLPDASLSGGLGRGIRGGAQSALPVPGGRGQARGSIPRGNFGARGNARGGGRGGIPQPGSQQQQGGAASMNPNANQFVPGAGKKRGLEASEHAGPDKRQRGK